MLRAPAAVLAAVGPNDTSEAAPPQADQRTKRLPHRPLKGALLGKHTAPVCDDGQKLRKQAHLASGRKEKVFFSGPRNRSPRPTFLLSEETRLSRSTVMPKWDWIRSRSWEPCSGERAFLSMTKAMSTCDRPL